MQLSWHWDTFECIYPFCLPFLLFYRAIQPPPNCFPSINRDFLNWNSQREWLSAAAVLDSSSRGCSDTGVIGTKTRALMGWFPWPELADTALPAPHGVMLLSTPWMKEWKLFNSHPWGQTWSGEETQVFMLYYVPGLVAKQWELRLVLQQQRPHRVSCWVHPPLISPALTFGLI